ncbi:MAG: hypothetical protein KAY91_01600 [Rhodocyclaceae bacterium]|nr:hypothetical protein [Rhodocyclaceae bacterium]
MKYKINSTGAVILADEEFINRYHAGDFTELPEAPAVQTAPQIVTRRQARQALFLRGKLDLVQPAIDAIQDATQRGLMQIEWDDSQEFLRTRPSLIAIGTAIGYDAAGLDDIFTFANTL